MDSCPILVNNTETGFKAAMLKFNNPCAIRVSELTSGQFSYELASKDRKKVY
jgi:hypothetical protein